jgi:hypothetical protein
LEISARRNPSVKSSVELKQAEHFEDDDDNYNDSDDVEDVSVHGSGIPRRYAQRQTIKQAVVARSRGAEEQGAVCELRQALLVEIIAAINDARINEAPKLFWTLPSTDRGILAGCVQSTATKRLVVQTG